MSVRFEEFDKSYVDKYETQAEVDVLDESDALEALRLKSLSAVLQVVGAAGELFKMYSNAQSDRAEAEAAQEIADKLCDIDSRLVNIETELQELRDILIDLSVRLDHRNFEVVQHRLKGEFFHIIDNMERWLKNVNDSRVRIEIRDAFTRISVVNRELSSYGFAHSIDLLLALAIELDLRFLLGDSAEEMGPSVERALAYISESLSESTSGSIGSSLRLICSEIESMKADDAALGKGVKHEIERVVSPGIRGEPAFRNTTYGILCGNLEEGYRMEIDREGWRGPVIFNVGPPQARVTKWLDETTYKTPFPYDLDHLNNVKAHYDFLRRRSAFMNELVESILGIKKNIEARVAWQVAYDKAS